MAQQLVEAGPNYGLAAFFGALALVAFIVLVIAILTLVRRRRDVRGPRRRGTSQPARSSSRAPSRDRRAHVINEQTR